VDGEDGDGEDDGDDGDDGDGEGSSGLNNQYSAGSKINRNKITHA
jgi:hypothetical protein